SKHFGGGVPISAVCTTAEIAKRAVASGFFATRSHAADPMLCAAGVASIDAIVEEDLAGRAARIELRMKSALTEMAKRYELIGDIRGRGVLLGLELVTDREQKTPANKEAAVVENRCLEAGLILQLRGTGPGRKNVLRFVPPMTTTDAEIDRALSILDDALAVAVGRSPGAGGIKALGGAKLTLLPGDTQNKVELGNSEAARLIDQGISVLIGPFSSLVAYSVRQVAEKNKTPFMLLAAVADNLTEGGLRYV